MILEEKTLYPSKFKSILLVLVCLIFLVGGVFIIVEGATMGWIVSGLFGICLLVAIIGMFPKANYLKLHQNGFELCSLFKKTNYKWEDVQKFRVIKVKVTTMVVFDFSEKFKRHSSLRKISKRISRSGGGLPDTYGLGAKELATLLNEYRQTYAKN